ncbi:MAG TPA: peptidoglycan DD-metalloendopeptidase family protein [Ferruginibacter sp.]|nr:peptidoglycan DD-metalloendopeptidase family protein [Ferruginibacter sp.]HRO17337.1 peptidoglycan DD-metalloendopeptidase family protein [Ferruginibacter sp.]HRQ21228.1 peptidoglycan DD-metalloendopeptidase family protein [Ferruginibacter sp.]
MMYDPAHHLLQLLSKHAGDFYPVVPYAPDTHTALPVQLKEIDGLTTEVVNHTEAFCDLMRNHRLNLQADYLYGGYREHRLMYQRSSLFGSGENRRTYHLGIDVWCEAGTPVFTPMGGTVHGVGMNEGYGNYGGTLIMKYQIETTVFYVLFGHLSSDVLIDKQPGLYLARGEQLSVIGTPEENGHWPPHLHIQLIADIAHHTSDYPGVCSIHELKSYTEICPNPQILLPFGNI